MTENDSIRVNSGWRRVLQNAGKEKMGERKTKAPVLCNRSMQESLRRGDASNVVGSSREGMSWKWKVLGGTETEADVGL